MEGGTEGYMNTFVDRKSLSNSKKVQPVGCLGTKSKLWQLMVSRIVKKRQAVMHKRRRRMQKADGEVGEGIPVLEEHSGIARHSAHSIDSSLVRWVESIQRNTYLYTQNIVVSMTSV